MITVVIKPEFGFTTGEALIKELGPVLNTPGSPAT